MASVIRASHAELYSAGKELFLAILEALADMFGMLLSDLGAFLADIPAYISGEKELFASAGDDIGTATKDSAENSLSELPDIGDTSIEKTIASMQEKINSNSGEMFAGLPDNLSASLDGMDLSSMGDAKMQELLTSFTNPSEFQASATDDMSGFLQGTETGLKPLPSTVEGKVSETAKTITSKQGEFRNAGRTDGAAAGSGFSAGLSSWKGAIVSKAAEIVRSAKASANSAMNAASPAKDLIQSGMWFGQGFEIGITRMIEPVGNAASKLVDEAKKPFNFESLVDSADFIPWDQTPSIQPVLDLSEYEAGLRKMQSLTTYSPMASMTMADRAGGKYGNSYSSSARQTVINLNYDAGASPMDMVNQMAMALKTKNLMEA